MTRKLITNDWSSSPFSAQTAATSVRSPSSTASTRGRISSVMAIATTASVKVMVRSRPGPPSSLLLSAIPAI